ncbi:ATP-binding protein [Streptomyces sp. x-80]|uniref:ATP-binding protein n=1 Tax=Streptomyces sp. x-80 TaxID=2789282 RepID=UPI0039810C4A
MDVAGVLSRGQHDWVDGLGLAAGGLVSLRYDGDADGLTRTRRVLEEVLGRWEIRSAFDDVALVVTELVANAIQHALADRGWLTVGMRGTGVICAVTDPSTIPPVVRSPLPGEESGYGLRIVEQLSESWGHSLVADSGKAVWARIPVDVKCGNTR